jgi:sugar lactone lactonase YvrE
MIRFRVLFAILIFLPASLGVSARAQQQDEIKGAVAEPSDAPEVRNQIKAVEKLETVVPDRAAVLYFLAAAKQHLGETLEALKLLRECVAAREGFDPAAEPAFRGLKDSKEFTELVENARRDYPPVAKARVAFVTEEKDLVPEGLAYDAKRDVFYLSSLNRRKIVQIAQDGKASDFVPADRDRLLPVLGIRLDPLDGSVWANCFAERGASELVHYDTEGKLLGRYAPKDSAKHGFNDLVLRKNGEIFLTDSLNNSVMRFDRKTGSFMQVVLHRPILYPNGIALADDDKQLFVADALGVVHVDLSSGASVDVNPGPHRTLAGFDGMYWYKDGLVGVQNGLGSPRIAAFRLSSDALSVKQSHILEYRSPLTALPTTGAIHGSDFYFIANSQIDNLNNDKVLDPTRLERVRIAAVHLPW